MDLFKLNQLINDNYINKVKHPALDIYSYCYSQKCEIEESWNDITLACRGLVLDKEGNILFNCAKKFFNKDQNQIAKDIFNNLDLNNLRNYEKLDGSFIKIFKYNKKLIIGSKTSFENEYTNWAKEIIERDNLKFEDGLSYHFELIVPENRIVVDYKKDKNLYLWAVIETKTGKELDIYDKRFEKFNKVKLIKDVESYLKKSNVEGIVIYDGKNRLKLKTQEYLKLHKIRTMCSKKRIIELLEEGKSIRDFEFPDEFIKDLIRMEDEIKEEFDKIYDFVIRYRKLVFEELNLSPKGLALNTSLDLSQFQKKLLFTVKNNNNWDKVKVLICKHIEEEEKLERIK